ncbi:MAG TPA: S8 family serine peptidase, partial [Bacteroidota bacterium]|nr:S8 family serine peptidase [Bacteroidota bacterium]
MNRRALYYIAVVVALMMLHSGSVHAQLQKKYWVLFADKGEGRTSSGTLSQQSTAYQDALRLIQPRALARRGKMLPADALVDAADLPLYQPYIGAIEKIGGVLVHLSRWLNAASFTLRPEVISTIRGLPFVTDVRPVAGIQGKPFNLPSIGQSNISKQTYSYNYGASLQQDTSVDVPVLHNLGITGKHVLVGLLDSGFRWKAHESLRTRHVVAEYDFVWNDSITANQVRDSPDQDFHGTLVMSVLGGYMPGELIGPAFDADFILGKTEYVPTETRQEEDNWAAGIEWMESYGVDVVSSSVGYNTFDPPDSGYSWLNNDFNGRTSITAQAAERACKLGVVICNSMGNEGNNNSGIGTLLTPADTDTLISVGAVSFSRQLASFSSQGPTSDGRIKPDVVAAGVGVYGALTPGPNTYGTESGTSLSTPLVAGSAALMLSVRPELTPLQVRNAFRSTAYSITNPSRFPLSPNNFTGWG